MAIEVLVSRLARRELSHLLTIIALESPSGARRLEAAVRDVFGRIADFPEVYPEIGSKGERMGLAARRIHVLYRLADDRAYVTRIVYAGYDLRRLSEDR